MTLGHKQVRAASPLELACHVLAFTSLVAAGFIFQSQSAKWAMFVSAAMVGGSCLAKASQWWPRGTREVNDEVRSDGPEHGPRASS
jgi:hypothetical protein